MELKKTEKMWMDDGKHTGVRRKTTQQRRGTSYRNDTTNIILNSFYGKSFEDAQKSDSFIINEKLAGKAASIRGYKSKTENKDDVQVVPFNMQKEFALIEHGYSPMTIMGKEWDKQWATHNKKRLIAANGYNSPILKTEMAWIKTAEAEKSTSVKEFLGLLIADRLTKNPELLTNLATKEELEKAGYVVSPMATPIFRGTKANGGYYDLSQCYQAPVFTETKDAEGNVVRRIRTGKPYFYEAPVYADENIVIPQSGGAGLTQDISSLKLFDATTVRVDPETGIESAVVDESVSEANFNDVMRRIERATGAKIEGVSNLSTTVTASRNILRTAGRRVVNFYRVKFNKRSTLLHDSYTIRYNKNATREERLYAVLSQVAELSTKPFIERTEKLVKSGKGSNLPSANEFAAMKETLSKFTTSMTTAELAKVVLPTAEMAAKLEGFGYLKAAQTLASKPELADDRHLISLASGFTTTAINRCAASSGMTLEDYEAITGQAPLSKAHNNSFLGAVFAKKDYRKQFTNPIFKPTGVIENVRTLENMVAEQTEIENTAQMFDSLNNLYNKLQVEDKKERELADACKLFFSWADEHEKTGQSFEKFCEEQNVKDAFKSFLEYRDFIENPDTRPNKREREIADSIKQFFIWADGYAGFAPEKPTLNESEEEVRATLEHMFGFGEKKAGKIRPWNKWNAVQEQLDACKNEEERAAIFATLSEDEQIQFNEDVNYLGKAGSIKAALWSDVCKEVNDCNPKTLDKESRQALEEFKSALPVGITLKENDLKDATQKDKSAMGYVKQMINYVEKSARNILKKAASDEKYNKMTGARVVKETRTDSFVKGIFDVFKGPSKNDINPTF